MTHEWDFDHEHAGVGHATVTDETTDERSADWNIQAESDQVYITAVLAERVLVLAGELAIAGGGQAELERAFDRGWHAGYKACKDRLLSFASQPAER
jgi:hypothetical protein